VSAKILIIEDNEQNMYLLTFLLNRHGHEVFQAGDGQQGIELAER
jgi:CheY-like chemotaxis protein